MRAFTDRFHVGQGSQIGPVTVFPVWTEAKMTIKYDVTPVLTLQVTELDSPTIGNLNISSTHHYPVLLPEGTVLDGGKQTRVLRRDVLIPRNVPIQVDTYCVEAGRWAGGMRHQVAGRAPLSVISALRGLRANFDTEENRAGSQQRSVWDSVNRYERSFGSRENSSLIKLMRDEDGVEKNESQERLTLRFKRISEQLSHYARAPLAGQSGIILGVGGHPVLLEIITSARSFQNHLETLLASIAMDAALAEVIPTPNHRARRFAELIMDTPIETIDAGVTGQLFAGEDEIVDIKALQPTLRGGAAIHTTVINKVHDLVLA